MNEPAKPLVEVQFRSGQYLALTKARLWLLGILLPLVGLSAWAVSRAAAFETEKNAWAVPLGNVGLTVSGVLLGLVLSLSPKPVTYTEVAVIAVDEMAELNRSTGSLVDRLAELAQSEELLNAPVSRLQLALISQELESQGNVQLREIARWSRVAPGSEDEIVKGRETTAAILRKLEREVDNE